MSQSLYIQGNPDMRKATVLQAGASTRAVPVGFGDGEVTWRSSNPAVATVGPSGEVRAVGAGTASITATKRRGFLELPIEAAVEVSVK